MRPSVFPQIDRIRRRLRRRRLAAATCQALALAIIAGMSLGFLDWALVVQDLPGRVLLTLLGVGGGFAILRRLFRTITRSDTSALKIAMQVERRYPELRDVVTSALDFSKQDADDPTAGSASLRRAVVLRAATAVEDVDWQQFINRQPLQRAGLACSGALLVFALLAWWTPHAVGTGFARLTNPLNSAQWPRDTQLEFVESPTKLAAGDDLVLELRNANGPLPDDVVVHYRTRQGEKWLEQSEPLAGGNDFLTVRRANVRKSLEYRATGGDHRSMSWQKLQIVPPPKITSLQVTNHYPQYTGLGNSPWAEGEPTLAGSRLEINGKTDRPIASAVLANEDGRRLPGVLGLAGHEFQVEFECAGPQISGNYFFEFVTPEGVTARSARDLAIEIIPDESPQVAFLKPTVEHLTLLPRATLPLVIEAHDDLAIETLELAVRRSDRSEQGDQLIPVWHDSRPDASRQDRFEYEFELTSLNLPPGSLVELHARATDFRPSTGQTPYPLKLSIVSEDDLWRIYGEREALLAEVIEKTLRQQRELRARTVVWMEPPKRSRKKLIVEGHAVLFGQRQIAGSLEDAAREVERLLRGYTRNQLDRPQYYVRLNSVRDGLDELTKGPLPEIDESVGKLIRSSQRDEASATTLDLKALVHATIEQQNLVISTLEGALDRLAIGNAVGHIERELASLAKDQLRLAEQCRVVSLDWLSRSPATIDHQLARLSSEQRQLAHRLAKLTARMAATSAELTGRQPLMAGRLANTVALARELKLQMNMRAAAEHIDQRRFGRSVALQHQAEGDLRRLYENLTQSHSLDEVEQLKQLRRAERRLQLLRTEVARLEHGQEKAELSSQEDTQRKALVQRTESLDQELESLSINEAAQTVRRAAERLSSDRPDRKASPLLDKAQRQLATERRRRQIELAELQMARLAAKIGKFVAREQAIVEEVARLGGLSIGQGELQHAQMNEVVSLAESQTLLSVDTLQEARGLTLLPVFAHLLRSAAADMNRVRARLESRQIDPLTQAVALEVVGQLRKLAEVLDQQQRQLAKDKQQSGGGRGSRDKRAAENECQAQSLQLVIGQLRVLKSLQTQLRERTEQWEAKQAKTPAERTLLVEEARRLASQQEELIRLAEQLTPDSTEPPPPVLQPHAREELP